MMVAAGPVANPKVPAMVRNALNVESGLNDGLALPFPEAAVVAGTALRSRRARAG